MMRQLADVMNHTPEVQRSHYIYPNLVRAQNNFHQMLAEGKEDEEKEA